MRRLATCMAMLIFVLGAAPFASAEVKIGINAPRGELDAMKQWGAIGAYFEKELGDKVTLVPSKVSNLLQAVEKGDLDFVLANPVQTIIMKEEHGATPIATMNSDTGSQFAGVIIAKKGAGITKAADLKGKKVMSLDSSAAAAYVFQTYYLIQKGIDPRKDCAAFVQGKKLDDLVLAVKSGVMDAAFIKSGTLEDMSKEGKISRDEFVVVDERKDPGFSDAHTTPLYPDWYFTATKKASAAVKAKMKDALLKLSPDHAASKAANIKGFIEALPLENLKAALKTLKLRPYDK